MMFVFHEEVFYFILKQRPILIILGIWTQSLKFNFDFRATEDYDRRWLKFYLVENKVLLEICVFFISWMIRVKVGKDHLTAFHNIPQGCLCIMFLCHIMKRSYPILHATKEYIVGIDIDLEMLLVSHQ